MPLFAKRKDFRVQSFVLKLVNNNCPELKALMDGPRVDSRVNLVVVVVVIPLEGDQLQIDRAFTTVTKEFSGTGVSIVLDQALALENAVLGFRCEGEMIYVRAEARHINPMGGGFFHLGFQMNEIVSTAEYPKLNTVGF
jgi:hypothetical protein